MDIKKAIEIANDLGLSEIVSSLNHLADKSDPNRCPLVIPLVGEFSAGKTTLINALTDNRQLETATKPTTATIYEIYFGNDSSYAEVYGADGELERTVEDIASLKNAELGDASLVKVFDTSDKISSSIVIVDTPGLSSPDLRHRQALVDYLPQADGILLVSDVNQQLTASLLNFIKTAELANRPVFLAITQCDLKAASDVEDARRYAASVSGIPLENIVCVSAREGQLDELYALFNRIQADKSRILNQVNDHRFEGLKNQMVEIMDQLIKTSNPDTSIDDVIRDQENKYLSLKRELENLIETTREEVKSISRSSTLKFEDVIFEQLDSLVVNNIIDYDNAARSAVDTTMRIMFNEYKNSVQTVLARKAKKTFNADNTLALSGLMGIDMSGFDMDEMPYNIHLNELGHEYDRYISKGIKITAAVALVVATVYTGGAAAGVAGAAKAAGAVTAASTAASAINTIQKGKRFISEASDMYDKIDQANHAHSKKGTMETLVSTVMDKSLGKPHRRRAIHEYVEMTLAPAYKMGLERITEMIVNAFVDSVQSCTANRLEEISNALKKAKQEQSENESAYKERMNLLKAYKKDLLNIE